MQAFQLLAHGVPGRFQLREVPDPQPGPGEVIVRVRACGLNRLDLWTEEGGLPIPIDLPRTPGCEISGEICQLGESVSGWHLEDRVAVQSNLFCGDCEFCAQGRESLCLNGEILGVNRDGGFAERVAVPANSLVRLPDNVTFNASAALTLAGSTAMHMLTDRVKVRPGDWILVIGGASGVGSAAIQIAKQLGAYVIATGSTPEKRELSTRLGADATVDSSQKDWAAEVRKITRKHGVDVAVEHVGGEVLQQIFACLARGGTIVTCGATAGRQVQINLWPLFVKEQRIIGSYGRNRADMVHTLEWAATGRIKPSIDLTLPLSETAAGFAALRNRTVKGKVIIQPDVSTP